MDGDSVWLKSFLGVLCRFINALIVEKQVLLLHHQELVV